ncbi:peptidoglycan-binding domain-containing protein [Streptomyces sp. NPDC051132]|uniref:peptidoglycan-binding domain-containing protein n=1 Tax=unclassified Streptomyces TaxID=2593676 RepID=UPI003428C822
MPLEQHINWTVLPAGLPDDGTGVRVSVFVAPRLLPAEAVNATLAGFPDFLGWPEKVKAATFRFATADGTATPPVPVPFTEPLKPRGPAPDTALWTSLFHEATPLEHYTCEAPKKEMRSYSARQVRDFTQRVYARAAKDSPGTPPPTNDMMRRVHAEMLAGRPGTRIREARTDNAVPVELAELDAFHRPSAAGPSATDGSPPGAQSLAAGEPPADGQPAAGPHASPPGPLLDFHTMLTSLGDHPVLLRRLGLVLDFVLPAGLPESDGRQVLTVLPVWHPEPGPQTYNVSCLTRYYFGPDPLPPVPPAPARRIFLPAAPPPTVPDPSTTADPPAAGDPPPPADQPAVADPLASPARGLVALAGDFSVEQADVDGAALKLLQVPEDATGLSPVRAHGIALVRHHRMAGLRSALDRAADQDRTFGDVVAHQREQRTRPPHGEASPPHGEAAGPQAAGSAPQAAQQEPAAPVLFADDLVRGHRLDIWDEDRARWFSLHAREVEYRRPQDGPLLLTAADEGFFQAHLVSPQGDPALYVPEPLVVWRGWSLAAPFPGLVLDTDDGDPDTQKAPNAPVPLRNEAPPGLPLEITVRAARGSLPALRYGRRYRLRLRTVDLAGNGLDLAQADALMRLPGVAVPDPPLVFRRFEAVPAPAVVPRLPLAEGASTFRMVLRSSPGDQPPPAVPDAPVDNEPTVLLARVKPGLTNDDIAVVQAALMAVGHRQVGGVDRFFGDMTRAAYAEEQRQQGFSGADADGVPGCESLTSLGRKAGFTADCGHGPRPAPGAGRTAEQYAAEFNRSPLVTREGHVPYQGADERHVVAPKTSLRCVEWHGLLDAAIGSTDHAVQDAVYELAVRESGALNDPGPGVRLETVGSSAANPGHPLTDPHHPAVVALHTGEDVPMRGLPDPLARGAALWDLPGMPPGTPFLIPWDGDAWHRPRSFRLRLAEGTAPPRFDRASRVLTVSLPPGAAATVRVCSALDFDADLMGMAAWSREPAPGTEAERAEELRKADHALELAAANGHWMFTPWHELTLVHAVQRPLRTPVLTLSPPTRTRARNATSEQLAGTIALDESSTGRIDLVAEWTEVTDEGPDGTLARPMNAPVFGLLTARASRTGTPGTDPAVLQHGVLTFDTQAAEDRATADKTPPLLTRHEFGDTKHRVVRYRPLAGSRFGDCFPPAPAPAPAPASAPAPAAGPAGPGPNALTVQGAAREHSVPSSAAPTAPQVLYCVPTLSLEQTAGPSGAVVRRRRGGGIRVYLARPWLSSGHGELLGVVLGEPPGGDPASLRDAWVTLMGRDPVHRSAPVVAPTPDVFTNAVGQPRKLLLPLPGGPLPVTVLGFVPQFDAGEPGGRWFCDLALDTKDACLPFVRLALVRYQPASIPGEEVSSVVLADLVRTLPDRQLTVRPGPPLSVTVTGPSWDPTHASRPRITATLQRRHDVVGDDDLGWVTLEDTATVLTSAEAESTRTPSYSGALTVPAVRHGAPLRLLVMETEGIPADGPAAPSAPQGPVIYCDTVDLPPGHHGHDDDGRDDHDRDDGRDDDDRRGPRHGHDGFGHH